MGGFEILDGAGTAEVEEIRAAAAVACPPALALRDVSEKNEALERSLIERALRQTGGNRTRAAKLLDLSHRALLYKIKEYGLD